MPRTRRTTQNEEASLALPLREFRQQLLCGPREAFCSFGDLTRCYVGGGYKEFNSVVDTTLDLICQKNAQSQEEIDQNLAFYEPMWKAFKRSNGYFSEFGSFKETLFEYLPKQLFSQEAIGDSLRLAFNRSISMRNKSQMYEFENVSTAFENTNFIVKTPKTGYPVKICLGRFIRIILGGFEPLIPVETFKQWAKDNCTVLGEITAPVYEFAPFEFCFRHSTFLVCREMKPLTLPPLN